MTKRKSSRPKPKYPQGKLYCMDCKVELTPGLTAETKHMMRELEMPNMPIFCDKCRGKLKNLLKRIGKGFQYLFGS